jgi:hypothetical protein
MEETRTAGMGLGDLQPVIDSNIASLTGMVGGLFAIDKVLDLVVEGYRDWSDEIENVKTHQQGLAVTTAQTLSASGDLLRMPELMRRAGGVQGATKDQWFAAFGGISGAAPTLPSSQREALADETARLAFLQRDPGAFARAVGDLAEAQPERTPQQTTGLALTLQRLVGDKFGEVSSDRFQRTVAEMTASGMSADQAMGVLVAGRRADLDPRTLETLALGMASSQGPGRIRGPEDVLKNKFYATQPGMERLALLQQRPDIANAVLGQGYDTRIGLLTPQAISDVQSAIAGSAGEGERQLAAAGGIPSVAREPLVGEFKSTPARSYGQAAQSLQTQEDLDEIFKAAGYSWAYRTAHARGAAFTRFLTGGEEPNLLPESIHRLQVVRSEVAGRSASTDQQRQDNEALVTRIDRMISLMEQQLNAQLKEAAKAPTVIPPNVDKANNQ